MTVTIKKIMFSGDVPQKKPSLWERMKARLVNNTKELEKVPQILAEVKQMSKVKKNMKEDIDYSKKSIKRNEDKLVEFKEDLKVATEKKQKETIKFLKGQVEMTKNIIAYSNQELKKYEAVLAEQE